MGIGTPPPPPQAIHIISKIPLKNILDPRTHLFHCICDPYKGRIEKEFYLCVGGGGTVDCALVAGPGGGGYLGRYTLFNAAAESIYSMYK